MEHKWVGVLSIVILSQLNLVLTHEKDDNSHTNSDGKSQVEVRAVFLNCESEILGEPAESEVTRFQRDELFKHDALKDCSKKLALTMKITSESGNSGDEYLPIEHVFEGSSEKRVRLLDPYILRIRRDAPRQAYLLRRLDTVTCVLTNDAAEEDSSRNRILRDLEHQSEKIDGNQPTPEVKLSTTMLSKILVGYNVVKQGVESCISNNSTNSRHKRNERNIVVETVTHDNAKWARGNDFYRLSDHARKSHVNDFNDEVVGLSDLKSVKPNKKGTSDFRLQTSKLGVLKKSIRKTAAGYHTTVKARTAGLPHNEVAADDRTEEQVSSIPTTNTMSEERISSDNPHSFNKLKSRYSSNQKGETEEIDLFEDSRSPDSLNVAEGHSVKDKRRDHAAHIAYSNEKDYAVYGIGSPDLWHTVHVQLFQKMSTSEGKTVWNDLTKGEVASVGSLTPEWTGQDLNVKYRSSNWMPREDFVLPAEARLCLLVPINDGHGDSYPSPRSDSYNTYEDTDYLVVPEEEMEGSNEDRKFTDNNTELESWANFSENGERSHRRVIIRVSRTVLKGNEDKLNLASQGTEKYLTLNHHRPHRAQIDLEARADENQLVRVGASGRISIAVSDNTRPARTVLNLQIGNTGLAAARYRVAARDCYPLLTDVSKNKEDITAGPILIPPRHTRSIRLELPVEIPTDYAHCSVSLVNDEGQSVAVRDVSIKKGDRCFCVWHCDCVCLSADPKLMCRDMDEARQKAAGLSTRDRTRHTRSVKCTDNACLDIISVLTGVLVILLLLGLCKAMSGLVCSCTGTWGMHMLLRPPRKLDHYYEKALRCRCVVYDAEGWPVHPDTKMKNVHVTSRPVEFILNIIFFVCVPCTVLCDVIRMMGSRYPHKTERHEGCLTPHDVTNEVFSTHDIQELAPRWRRRREGLRRWMTPQAQELSTDLWHESLKIHSADPSDGMRPFLTDNQLPNNMSHNKRPPKRRECPDSCADSEQDDTEYVLTQMQKSRESLAKSQKRITIHDPSSNIELHKKGVK